MNFFNNPYELTISVKQFPIQWKELGNKQHSQLHCAHHTLAFNTSATKPKPKAFWSHNVATVYILIIWKYCYCFHRFWAAGKLA